MPGLVALSNMSYDGCTQGMRQLFKSLCNFKSLKWIILSLRFVYSVNGEVEIPRFTHFVDMTRWALLFKIHKRSSGLVMQKSMCFRASKANFSNRPTLYLNYFSREK